jgi:multidrug efflux pump
MSPSRLFILRPVATSLLMVALVLAGAVAYTQLPVSALPQVDYPTIQVQTFYPGAAPEVMEQTVTAPLERQLGQVPGLSQMTSTSSSGSSSITLQFDLDLNIDVAEQQVQAAINASATFLPADLPTPPIYSKSNPADAPIMTLALSSHDLQLSALEDLADTRLAPRLAEVGGVGLVSISGGQKPAVRIRVNPTALAARGLTMESVRVAVAAANVNQANGSLDGPRLAYTIDSNDQLLTSKDYAPLVIAEVHGAPVRLMDVADVVDGVENVTLAAWKDRQPAVVLNIRRQPGANIIQVVDSIKRLLPALAANLPASARVEIVTDRTVTIRASVADVRSDLILTVVLVVLVIFLFLRKVSATAIPSVAVPVSLVGTLAAMYLLGFSLNNLTLMALTISTGFVVDDAIVMIENIIRHLDEGMPPLEAALLGAGEIGFTIVSLTISMMAALIPLLFMGDIVGRLFREFSITLGVTIALSAVVSLTLTPMMCRLLLRTPTPGDQPGRLSRATERAFEAVIAAYGRALRIVLRHHRLTLVVAVAALAATVLLYIEIPKGFFPVQDTGELLGVSEAPADISFPAMAARQQALVDVILRDPAVAGVTSFIGIDGTNVTLGSGRIQVTLKPLSERASADDVIHRLQSALAGVVGIRLYLQPVQDLTVDDRVSRTQYQYTVGSPDSALLSEWVPRLVARLQALPELADVASDLQEATQRLDLVVDRDEASRLGITPLAIDNALYDAFGQRQISTMFTQRNQYHVILEAAPGFKEAAAALGHVYLPSATGGMVPLSSVARAVASTGAVAIARQGQFPVATISFNLGKGASLGASIAAVERAARDLGMPAGVETAFQGTAHAFSAAVANEPLLILAALITVYIVLGVLYESYIHPLTILSTLPSAGVGALLALRIAGADFDVVGLIAIILLIGIVKKNGIMMVDFALEAQRKEGKSATDAIYQACLLRFRPITMTTMAALLAGLPLAFGHGVGFELRRPLGIAIVGGMLFSQAMTLFTTPVIYLAFEGLAERFRPHRAAGAEPATGPGPGPAPAAAPASATAPADGPQAVAR